LLLDFTGTPADTNCEAKHRGGEGAQNVLMEDIFFPYKRHNKGCVITEKQSMKIT